MISGEALQGRRAHWPLHAHPSQLAEKTRRSVAASLGIIWINDDDDTSGGHGEVFNPDGSVAYFTDTETVPPSSPDYAKHEIVSARNLEDFARLWVDLSGLQSMVTTSGGIQVGLKWKSFTGSPAVNLYVSADAAGSDNYLKNDQAAYTQITNVTYSHAITFTNNQQTVNTTGTFIFPLALLQTELQRGPVLHLLFEGAGIGTGQLSLVLLDKDGNQIGEGPGVWFDLMSIKSMYQRVKVTPRDPSGIPAPFVSTTTFDASATSTQPSDDGYSFAAPADESQTALVFVHGSNIPYEEARWNAETMLKRLWWQGYKGRFVLFYWDTLVGPFDGTLPAPYNLNEYRSWKYGPALNNYVANSLPTGYAKNVIGHSLGNGVLVSALREGMVARNVILMQAAMPASCFDSSAQTLPGLVGVESQVPTPDTASQKGYRGVVEANLNATLSSIYNENDYALGWWVTNQENRKPEVAPNFDLDYYYTWTASGGGQLWKFNAQGNVNPPAVHYFVTDSHESMAFIARSRTTAAGRTTVGGSIGNNLNVSQDTELNFGDTRPDHSGEFTRPIQQLWPFYRYIFVRAR